MMATRDQLGYRQTTQSCIPPEQAVGELYAEDAALQRKRLDRTAASFQAIVSLAILVLRVRRLVSDAGGRKDHRMPRRQ
jgi:hypothetical protein